MEGQRILITGGNSGIGLVASRELARQGAEVILACRDTDKTKRALESINANAATPAVNLPVDLASLASVRHLAETFLERYDRLDVLINNAGLFPARQQLTADGFEMQIGVNHLSHFLLTNLLLDTLRSSAPARVVTVSSKLHLKGQIDFDSFKDVAKYSAQVAYNQSKLANVLFSAELAERLQGSGVTANALHPGGVATDIVRDLPWLVRKLIGMIFISPEQGAKTTLMLASDPSLAHTSGAYFDQGQRREPSALTQDELLRQQLWDNSAQAVGL